LTPPTRPDTTSSQPTANALGDLGDAACITPILSRPVDQQIVVLVPRQHMKVNVNHRLSGDDAIRLHEAESMG
jgi:hypothetical protein